ncbi:MAG: hypothetical protein ABI629_02745 [bacterium]
MITDARLEFMLSFAWAKLPGKGTGNVLSQLGLISPIANPAPGEFRVRICASRPTDPAQPVPAPVPLPVPGSFCWFDPTAMRWSTNHQRLPDLPWR